MYIGWLNTVYMCASVSVCIGVCVCVCVCVCVWARAHVCIDIKNMCVCVCIVYVCAGVCVLPFDEFFYLYSYGCAVTLHLAYDYPSQVSNDTALIRMYNIHYYYSLQDR